ncbi:MAG: glycosyltransferase [Candidatus Sulfotelmatobacter sp.]|jgi:mannosyltransferase OCH1-like enzyme
MRQESDSPEHHRRRSEFIRELVQRPLGRRSINNHCRQPTPRTIVQFWHDLGQLPPDVEECVRSWTVWETSGFEHRLFDERTAGAFISSSLSARHKRAFERCYHPAMQADYFRLCYVLAEGGFYVDADDVCIGTDIGWLAEDGRLKLQPLCYDIATGGMVKPAVFLRADAYDPSWIFYFNNNPLIASPGHPVIEHALSQATRLLELAGEDELPEIQMATGPGNISKSIFDLGTRTSGDIESNIVALKDWDSLAVSKWPLSYRDDARNWRLSNQKRF